MFQICYLISHDGCASFKLQMLLNLLVQVLLKSSFFHTNLFCLMGCERCGLLS